MPNFLTILNLVATFGLIVGGLLAYHHGFARTATEVQERVIRLLQSEIGALQDRIDALEKENTPEPGHHDHPRFTQAARPAHHY